MHQARAHQESIDNQSSCKLAANSLKISLLASLACIAATSTASLADPASSSAQTPPVEAGFGTSRYSFTLINYTGDCPGSWYSSWDNVSFRSETALPAQFQRVRITNINTGGYTDREYDERRARSESFSMRWLPTHSGRFLAVRTGSNTLDYVISNRQTGVIETGRFQIEVEKQEKTEERDFRSIEQLKYCDGERDLTSNKTNIYDCKDGFYYNEKLGVCPDGSKQKISRRKVFNY